MSSAVRCGKKRPTAVLGRSPSVVVCSTVVPSGRWTRMTVPGETGISVASAGSRMASKPSEPYRARHSG